VGGPGGGPDEVGDGDTGLVTWFWLLAPGPEVASAAVTGGDSIDRRSGGAGWARRPGIPITGHSGPGTASETGDPGIIAPGATPASVIREALDRATGVKRTRDHPGGFAGARNLPNPYFRPGNGGQGARRKQAIGGAGKAVVLEYGAISIGRCRATVSHFRVFYQRLGSVSSANLLRPKTFT
jgi:hypothetical protein